MRYMIIRWLTLSAAIVATAYLLDGIRVSGFMPALAAAVLLSLLNAVLRPVALLLTLPINILTLGLFTFVINALMLKTAAWIIPGFEVQGFWAAVLGALIISIISWLLHSFIGGGRVVSVSRGSRPPEDDTIDLHPKGDDRWE